MSTVVYEIVEEEEVQHQEEVKELPEGWRSDWPAPTGEIDLAVHDLPHASSTMEWWYFNAHVEAPGGRTLSLFASFFRFLMSDDGLFSHALTWALVDESNGKHYPVSVLDSNINDFQVELVDNEPDVDPRIRAALRENAERKGSVPKPTLLTSRPIGVAWDSLSLDFEGNTLTKDAQGRYHLHLQQAGRSGWGDAVAAAAAARGGDAPGLAGPKATPPICVDVVFAPSKAPARNLGNGQEEGGNMFYYLITRNAVSGSVRVGDEALEVSGMGWYDREFGGRDDARCMHDSVDSTASGAAPVTTPPPESPAEPPTRAARRFGAMQDVFSNGLGWRWLCGQLDDGTDLTAVALFDKKSKAPLNGYCMVNPPDGAAPYGSDVVSFEPAPLAGPDGQQLEGSWISATTFTVYPLTWRLAFCGWEVEVRAVFPQQEVVTFISRPGFWEGRVELVATRGAAPGAGKLRGLGFVELSGYGYGLTKDLTSLFNNGAQLMLRHMDALLPPDPAMSSAQLMALCTPMAFGAVGEDLGVGMLRATLLDPLREICTRGGKAWRSSITMVLLSALGVDPEDHVHGIAGPELLHMASLIIDDIQDDSQTRRGSPCVHLMYGVGPAINAANYAYFLAPRVLGNHLPDPERLAAYEIYMSAMMAAHIGQGADIHGLTALAEDVATTGTAPGRLAAAVLAIHRLKSGVAVRALGEQAAVTARAGPQVRAALGQHCEALGTAFQMVDDVVNLEGFKEESWKTTGEDIMAGKITYPVALALELLEDAEVRRKLWATISSKPSDLETVRWVIDTIRNTGALALARERAHAYCEASWAALDPLLATTESKMTIRAFGTFLLDRHY